MKQLRWILPVVVLAFAAPAFGQDSACPSNPNECPTDVGACLAESCPCSADKNGDAWKNHGQYVKCVVQLRNRLRKAECLDRDAKRTIARCAARSTCGKDDAVLCCVYDTSATCSDPMPGDGVDGGTCSNDDTVACDGDADCITVVKGPKVVRHPENCTERGGTIVGTGSACGECPLPPPAP
jgi:hypothetical protein